MSIDNPCEHTFLSCAVIPKHETYSVNFHREITDDSPMVFKGMFTLYPKTSTIGVIVTFSRQASSTMWADRFINGAIFYKEAFEYQLHNTLLSIVDEFGGALHINGNTALVKGDKELLLSLFNPTPQG
jgi:hypothetical protein